MRAPPPLGLDVEIETPSGLYRLDSDSRLASKRPRGMNFSTQRGDGFATGGVSVARRILKDYPDIGLRDAWRFVGKNGEVAYEGMHHSNPRSNDPAQQLDVSLVGFATTLKNRKINPLYVDGSFNDFQGMSNARRAMCLGWNLDIQDFSVDGGGTPALVQVVTGPQTSPRAPLCEAWFDAGVGNTISEVVYAFTTTNANALFGLQMWVCDDDVGTNLTGGANIYAPSSSGVFAPTTPRRWLLLQWFIAGQLASDGINYTASWTTLRIHGNTGVARRSPAGVYISDVMRDAVGRSGSRVKWAGNTNTYPVKQADYRRAPANPYEIVQKMNDLALWETNVWEGPLLHFEPADLTTYDWRIRTDDPGVKVRFQGDSIETFANGVTVTYTDFYGVKQILYPSDFPDLRDSSDTNPANRWGEQAWTDCEIADPTFIDDALQYGRIYLAEFNRPKRPGQYTILGGYIKNFAGHLVQGWMVRNSQTVGIMDHPDDAPRLITATRWDQTARSLDITVDAPPKYLDAIVARTENARQAANLS